MIGPTQWSDSAPSHRLAPALVMGAAVVWCLWLWSAPVWRDRGPSMAGFVSAAAYRVGAVLCHQRPDRSFQRAEVPLPVCGRCAGLYVGSVVGLVAASLRRRVAASARRARVLLGVAVLPSALTLVVEWLGVLDPGNMGRAAAALPAGAVSAMLIGCALRDVAWGELIVPFCASRALRPSGGAHSGRIAPGA